MELHSTPGILRSGRTNYDETTSEIVSDPHDGSGIIELIAIFRCRKDRHATAVGEELVAILNDLMSTGQKIQVEALQKLPQLKGNTESHAILYNVSALYFSYRRQNICIQQDNRKLFLRAIDPLR